MAQYLCIWVRAYRFSVTSFSKWLPGGHIGFFSFWMAWFRQHNPSLLWNFSFKFHVHVPCGCMKKPNDCQICRFQNGCLVIFRMFNCNPPIAHCHPLLWGGGILVDHWSTSSCYMCYKVISKCHGFIIRKLIYLLLYCRNGTDTHNIKCVIELSGVIILSLNHLSAYFFQVSLIFTW